MTQNDPVDKPAAILQDIEVVLIGSYRDENHDEKIGASRQMIAGVLDSFLHERNISPEQTSLINSFLFIFNG